MNCKKITLSECIEIIGGGTPKTSKKEYWGGEIPWLSVVDFNNDNRYVSKTEKTITQEGLDNCSSHLLGESDIILSARGTVGALAQLSKPMAFNQSCYGIRSNNLAINDYIYYLLKHSVSALKKNSYGSVFDTITRETFSRIEILLPDLKTQKKISAILGSLDNKIELNEKINQNLEAQAQAIFKSWFVDRNNPERKVVKAEEIFDISIGKTPPRKETKWFSKGFGDICWISISDMGCCGAYISSSSEYLTKDAISKFNIKIVPDNTVILSFKLTVGRVAITDGMTTTNEAIAHFSTKNKSLTEYLYCYLKNYNFQSMGNTSSIATAINSKIIKNMPLVLPENGEVTKFHNATYPLFLKIKMNLRESNRLAQLRDALLPKLMSGEIDVSDVAV